MDDWASAVSNAGTDTTGIRESAPVCCYPLNIQQLTYSTSRMRGAHSVIHFFDGSALIVDEILHITHRSEAKVPMGPSLLKYPVDVRLVR